MGLFILGFHISVGEKPSNETDKGLSVFPTEEIILQKHLAGSVALTTLKIFEDTREEHNTETATVCKHGQPLQTTCKERLVLEEK